jgi:hypothetical protein
MANQDPQKVYVSFNGRSVTGWGEDGPVIQRPERVQTNWGLQGYSESQQHYDGDRTITLNLYVSSEGYQYMRQCFYNRTRGELIVRDTNSDNPITYRVDIAQVKQIGDVQPGTNNQIEVTWDCASEIIED